MKVSEVLDRAQIQDLLKVSNFRGALAVFTTWAIIGFSFALVVLQPHPISYLIALILLGGRHLALAILMHEATHYTLFSNKKINDFIGQWFCAYPSLNDLTRYREHHLRHHKFTGTAQDPDMGLVTPYPVSKGSLFRKFARDLFGITGVYRLFYLSLMNFGIITYTISTGSQRISQKDRSYLDIFLCGAKRFFGPLLTNTCIFMILYLLGHPLVYFLWVASYLTTFSLFLRIRAIAEHACTPSQTDDLQNTRSTKANVFARLTVAPHNVNYHLEHHMLMTVPYNKLPLLRKLLLKNQEYLKSCYSSGYLKVIRLAMQK